MKFFLWKRTTRLAASCLGLAISCPVVAQSMPPAVTLPTGTPVTLVFLSDLSSGNVAEGASVPLVLANNLMAGGTIAMKSGTKAFATVTMAVKARAAGRSGALTLHLESLHAGNQTIPLRVNLNGNSTSDVHYERPYHLKFPMGLFRTGDDVEIRSGTALTVFIAEDVKFPANN